MSEPYEFSVGYSTTFDQIEALRCWYDSFEPCVIELTSSLLQAKMLKFVRTERRDYFPVFDIVVLGGWHHLTFPDPLTNCDDRFA